MTLDLAAIRYYARAQRIGAKGSERALADHVPKMLAAIETVLALHPVEKYRPRPGQGLVDDPNDPAEVGCPTCESYGACPTRRALSDDALPRCASCDAPAKGHANWGIHGRAASCGEHGEDFIAGPIPQGHS